MSPCRATVCLLSVALAATPLVAQTPSAEDLPPGARMRLGNVGLNLGDGDAMVTAAALSPDGKFVVGGRNRIMLFERATGKAVGAIAAMTPGPPLTMRFAPAGNVLAVGSMGSVVLVETPSGKVLHELEVNEENFKRPSGISFSADGRVVAVGMIGAGSNKKSKAFAWAVATGKSLGEFEVAQNASCACAVSPDGKMLATWGRHVVRMIDEDEKPGQTIQLWEVATGKELRRIVIDRPNVQIMAGAFAPDGKQLAINAGTATFYLFDPHTGNEVRRFAGRRSTVTVLQYSRDGRLLVAGSVDGSMQAWQTADGKRVPLVRGRKSRLLALACPSAEHVLVLGGVGPSLVWWDAVTGEGSPAGTGHQAAVVGLAYTRDGKLLRSISPDGKVLTWDAATGKVAQQISIVDPEDLLRITGAAGLAASNLALSPNARFAATKSIYNTIRLWDLVSGEVACDFDPGKRPTMTGLAFTPDGSRLAAAMMNQIHVWDTEAGHEAGKLAYQIANGGMANGAPRLAYAPDGKRLALVTTSFDPNDGTATARITLLDVATGKELRATEVPLTGPGQGQAPAMVAFAPDIRFMSVPGGDRIVLLLRVESGKEYRRLTLGGLVGSITAIVFAPDGRTVAIAHTGAQAMGPMGEMIAATAARIEVFELASGQPRAAFSAHLGGVNCLAFAPDSLTLASGGADTTVIQWNVATSPYARPVALSAKELASAWAKLAQPDAQAAFAGMRRLIGSPTETAEFLKQQLRPAKVAAVEEKQIAGWVADLDSENFDTRDSAFRSLEKTGILADAALRTASGRTISLEMRRRIDDLLDKIERGKLSSEELQAARGVEVLERIATAPARALLAALADGAPSAVLTREARQALQHLKLRLPR